MKPIVIVVSLSLAAAPATNLANIPEALRAKKYGISDATHDMCLQGWEDWVASNEKVKKLDAKERHCLFTLYQQQCSGYMDGKEEPSDTPGLGRPAITDEKALDEAMTDAYQEHCFKFTGKDANSGAGVRIGWTKRAEQTWDDGDGYDHVRRRTQRWPEVRGVKGVGLSRPMSAQERIMRSTGTK